MENKKYSINRREFLKRLGLGTAITTTALAGCKSASSVDESDVPTDKMTYRTNHNTGDKVSILGYGCMRWPRKKTGKNENELDQEAINELVDYALEHGVNFFDTAPVYCQGRSEAATGIALKRHPRNKYFIATKLSNFSNASRENSILMYKRSLELLQVDYIDYYLLHSLGGRDDFHRRYLDNGMIDYLMEERKAGRIRNLGFSFHGNLESIKYILSYHEKVHWDFCMIQMNYSDWRFSDIGKIYDLLAEMNIPTNVMEPLLGGRLSNVPKHIADRLKAQEPEKSVASWAFRFVGSYPNILSIQSGMVRHEHLVDNIRTFSPLKPLSEEEKQFLFETAEIMRQSPTIPCNDCKYCMPCPYGLDIPGSLLHYNKCVNEGNYLRSSEDENYKKARRAFLVGYDRAVEKERQASHCVGCRQCNPLCPQQIDIPKQMRMIDGYVERLKQGKEF